MDQEEYLRLRDMADGMDSERLKEVYHLLGGMKVVKRFELYWEFRDSFLLAFAKPGATQGFLDFLHQEFASASETYRTWYDAVFAGNLTEEQVTEFGKVFAAFSPVERVIFWDRLAFSSKTNATALPTIKRIHPVIQESLMKSVAERPSQPAP